MYLYTHSRCLECFLLFSRSFDSCNMLFPLYRARNYYAAVLEQEILRCTMYTSFGCRCTLHYVNISATRENTGLCIYMTLLVAVTYRVLCIEFAALTRAIAHIQITECLKE